MNKRLANGSIGMAVVLALIVFLSPAAHSAPPKKDLYQIKIYRAKTSEQLARIEAYLKDAYLPALHKAGIKKVGVFKPLSNDTATGKAIYVFIPFTSLKAFMKLDKTLRKNAAYQQAAKNFAAAPFNQPPYERLESILLEAFDRHPHFVPPAKNEATVFELRSYESPTENLHEKKVAMFETGGEVDIFDRLGFNTVFYARVLSGSRMPNFMYMPSFVSVAERDAHWKSFGADPQWKEMSAKPENENKVSVSRIESTLMRAATYSDL